MAIKVSGTIVIDDSRNLNAGIITATSGFSGNLTGEVNAAAFDTNASGVVVTGVTTSSSGFVGALTGNVTGTATSTSSASFNGFGARTIQSGGTASGGSNGDIFYIY